MNLNSLTSQKMIRFGLFFLLLTPLVFLPWMWRPAQTSKFLFLLFFVELVFLSGISLFKVKPILQTLRHPVVLWSGVYVLFVILSSLFGVDPWNSFLGSDIRIGGWLLLTHAWVFCVLLFVFLGKAFWKQAELLFVSTGAVVSVYAILEMLNILPTLAGFGLRASSVLGNPIYLAAYLIFPLTIALARSLSAEKNPRQFFRGAAFVIFFGIVVSGTRGAFVGLLAGLLVFGGLYLKNLHNRRKIYTLIFAFLILCISGLGIARAYIPKDSFYGRYVYFADSNIFSRLEFWKMAAQGIVEYPLMGVGYENYYHIAEKHYSPALYTHEGNYSDKPHNAFIEILVSSGVIGFLLYLTILFHLIRSIHDAKKQKWISDTHESILYFGLTAYLVQNFFAFDTVSTFFTFAFFLAYVASLSTRQKSVEFVVRSQKAKITLLSISVLFLGFLFVVFYFPTYVFFSTLARANSEPDSEERFKILQSIPVNKFVYDHNALGKLYHNGAKQLYEQVGNTPSVKAYVQSALESYEIALKQHPKRGEYWYQKADMGLLEAFLNDKQITDSTRFAVEKAIEFTPNRTEPYLVKATELEMDGRIQDAISLLEDLYEKNTKSDKLAWTLSVLHAKVGNNDRSAELGFEAIRSGLKVAGLESILDLINFYAEKNDIEKVIVLYKKATNIFPDKIDLHANLAAAYAANGQIDEAIASARKYAELNPQAKAETEAFIQSLQK